MKLLQFVGLTVLTTLAAEGSLYADVLTFDTVSAGSSSALIEPGYGGFHWGPLFGVLSSRYYDTFYGTSVAFPSEPNAAFNGLGVPAVTVSGAPFAFNGANFATFVQSNNSKCVGMACSSANITVNGYLGGHLVANQTFTLAPNGTFSFFAANSGFGDVDTLEFLSDGVTGTPGRWWLMDNFTFALMQAPVPEPSSVISLATVLGALWLAASRKLLQRARGSDCKPCAVNDAF
jgi:hypothetical protein